MIYLEVDSDTYFFNNVLTFVKWRTLPGRGRVPVMGVGERAKIGKTPKEMNLAIAQANHRDAVDRARKRGVVAFEVGEESYKYFDGEHPMSDFTQNLSSAEHFALMSYKGTGYEGINKSLRDGVNTGSTIKIHALTDILERAKTSESFHVYRGIRDVDLEKGQIFVHKNFASTSLNRIEAEGFLRRGGSNTILEFDIPKGTKAVQLMTDNFANRAEAELTLQRGSKFKVKSVRNDFSLENSEKIKIATLELVSQEVEPLPFSQQEFKEVDRKEPARSRRFISIKDDIEFVEE